MKEFNYLIKLGLARGLRKTDKNPRNQQALVLSTGMVPEDGALSSVPELNEIDVSTVSPVPHFPYPQVFVLKQLTIVCMATAIYERTPGGDLTLLISGLTEGIPWTVADFHNFIVLANGKQFVFRNGDDLQWTTTNRYALPVGTSVLNFKGQLIITAPDTADAATELLAAPSLDFSDEYNSQYLL